jgi:iron-sulfur cluster assembly protein
MFEITENAATQVGVAAEQGGTEGMVLRLAAHMKQDGTIDYLMGFDEPKEADVRVVTRGVEVVMEERFVSLLGEAVMDYVELEQGEFRFIFLNPHDVSYTAPKEK